MRQFFRPSEAPTWLVAVLKSIREALGDIWPRPLRVKDYATADLPDAATFKQGITYDSDEQVLKYSNGIDWLAVLSDTAAPYESHILDIGDETTAITAGTAKKTFRAPYAVTLEHPEAVVAVSASLTTASTSGAVTVDINEDGVSILSTKLTIDQDEKTSRTAATTAVLSDDQLAFDAEMTIDIDGAGTGAAGLKVIMVWKRLAENTGILLSGDMTDGDDVVLLSGDMSDGNDLELQSI